MPAKPAPFDVAAETSRLALTWWAGRSSAPSSTWRPAVSHETLRLYPSAWMLERDALEDDEIGGCHIPAGSTVVVSPYVSHRNANVWHNPQGFDPDRFELPFRVTRQAASLRVKCRCTTTTAQRRRALPRGWSGARVPTAKTRGRRSAARESHLRSRRSRASCSGLTWTTANSPSCTGGGSPSTSESLGGVRRRCGGSERPCSPPTQGGRCHMPDFIVSVVTCGSRRLRPAVVDAEEGAADEDG